MWLVVDDMNSNRDQYMKYSITNAKWELGNVDIGYKVGMGEYMERYMLSCDGDVGGVVINEVRKLGDIKWYYVRKLMSKELYRLSKGINTCNDVSKFIWELYNNDPWKRRFPNFVDGSKSDMYMRGSNEDRTRYGYWIYYNDNVLSSDVIGMTGIDVSDIKDIPMCIVHTTTLEGVVYGCLDIVNGFGGNS